jgi:3-oxoacyl-[acyl-carrier protein] reductase
MQCERNLDEMNRSGRESERPRVALITGGVRGIGRAVTLALAERGWTVAACYRTSESGASELKSTLGRMGAECFVVNSDVSIPQNADSLVRQVEEQYGGIDALINCVGAYHRIHLMQESVEGWHSMFDHNLHPVFYLSRAAAPGMIRRKYGRIVNFSMVNADQQTGQPYVTAHYIAKIGVLVLTRSLAKTLAPYGITANTVSPGFIETGSSALEEVPPASRNIPAGVIGTPQDAVGAVLYLLSDAARYVNGTNIKISGAWGV